MLFAFFLYTDRVLSGLQSYSDRQSIESSIVLSLTDRVYTATAIFLAVYSQLLKSFSDWRSVHSSVSLSLTVRVLTSQPVFSDIQSVHCFYSLIMTGRVLTVPEICL